MSCRIARSTAKKQKPPHVTLRGNKHFVAGSAIHNTRKLASSVRSPRHIDNSHAISTFNSCRQTQSDRSSTCSLKRITYMTSRWRCQPTFATKPTVSFIGAKARRKTAYLGADAGTVSPGLISRKRGSILLAWKRPVPEPS